MCKISYVVDLSGCGGFILFVISIWGFEPSGHGEEGWANFFLSFFIYSCILGWLGLHAAACANATSHASKSIGGKS
jgi:hypothetical protein